MSFPGFEYENPFEPPKASIGGSVYTGDLGDIGDAELIRLAHIGHETNVKSLGHLNYLGAFFGAIYTIIMFVLASGMVPIPPPKGQEALDPSSLRLLFGGFGALFLVGTALNGALGYGLTHLQNWARWTTLVFTVLGLIYTAVVTVGAFLASPILGAIMLLFGGGINGFILYLLVSTKAGVVFSPEYKVVIKKTPHVKMKTSIIVKIALVILILVILGAVFSAIFGGNR